MQASRLRFEKFGSLDKFGGHCPSVPGIALRDLYPQPEEISTEARLPLQEEVELGTVGKSKRYLAPVLESLESLESNLCLVSADHTTQNANHEVSKVGCASTRSLHLFGSYGSADFPPTWHGAFGPR